MPPRKRMSNIAKLLPRKRSSTPDAPALAPLAHAPRDCSSLPAGFRAPGAPAPPPRGGSAAPPRGSELAVSDAPPADVHELELRANRNRRFAQRYETSQLPCSRAYPAVEEAARPAPRDVQEHEGEGVEEEGEREGVMHAHDDCDIPSLRHEVRLLRHDHAMLSETARETLRLAEALEARVESMQRNARPSERLFWLVLDGVSAVLLLLFSVIVRPWGMVKRYFVVDRVARRRSWRISVGDFENDPFLGDVAKRLSFSAVED